MQHIILGTAGHIDHWKSALVKALTGIDPDRLKEEKERGITIDLGFADLRYPDGLTVGIVDVPGHERLIRNMLAGAGGIDMVLFVIAADEGGMPQSREHLSICNLLNIRTGIIAVTKVDLMDDDWLELVIEDERIVSQIREFYKTKNEMTVRNFKDCCGVPGKYAIIFLNHLDSIGITRRMGAVRILLNKEEKQEKNMAETVVR